ncbi:MAG: ATP synthase F1 subunit gamma [Candidatus Cloacimonetes bacterium]|nr:ATP synthase F1 subunit gamma [Candidatus Cloacimonadota bacterium]
MAIRDIKIRIDSVKNTRQITNAMKMVAASHLRRAQTRILAARPYANHLDTMLRTLKKKNVASRHILLDDTPRKGKELLVVVTADRGLCGSFNTGIIRRALSFIQENPNTDIVCVGRKGYDSLRKRTDRVIEHYVGIFNDMEFFRSRDVADHVLDLYLHHDYARIKVLYNEFKSAIQQNIIIKTVLPVQPLESDIVSSIDYIYEPDEDTVIEELGCKVMHVDMWRIMLESSAAEQGARMTAMDSATDNATEMIGALTLQFNRERQAAITTEIIEIASGADAINQ